MKKIIANKIWTIFILSCWVFLAVSVNFLGIIEGYINPVVKKISILSFEENQLYGSVEKIRPCKFIDMEWYILSNGDYLKVKSELPENIVNFYSGNHIFGPMELLTSKDNLEKSRLRLYHECSDYIFTNNVISIITVDTVDNKITLNIN